MSESFLQLKINEYDGINFYRNDENIEVDSFQYTEPFTKLEGSAMGDLYDIIIFPEDPPKMPERFKAILSSLIFFSSCRCNRSLYFLPAIAALSILVAFIALFVF